MTRFRGLLAWLAPAIIVAVGAVIALIVTIAPATTENTSSAGSAGRVPVPGTHTFTLQAKKYAIWYGLDNAPLNYQMHLPPLSFDIRPPAGVADPAFTESAGTEHNSGGLSIRRAAYLQPSVAGQYSISVRSENGPGGVLLLGEALPEEPPAVLPGLLVLAGALVIAGVVALVIRRRAAA
jgi:hypothetical protein